MIVGFIGGSVEYDYFNLQNADHFSSAKYIPTGSIGGDITDYEYGGGNSGFNATTGEWTAANTGIHLMTISGFPEGGKSGGERQQQFFVDGMEDARGATRDYNAGSGSGSSACIAFFQEVTAGEVFNYNQVSIDRAEHVHFAAIYMPTSEMDGEFQGWKATGSGSVGGTIAGYTEEFDPDSAFNPTTGVYTAANAGLYLIFGTGFPTAATSANNHGLTLLKNGSPEGYVQQVPNPWNVSAVKKLGCVLLDLSASDTIAWRQDADTMDHVFFGGCRLTGTSAYFSARKATASGSPPDTITGWTEDFDVGSNFNATTGVFTAPSAGTWWFTWTGGWSSSGSNEQQMRLNINGDASAGETVVAREFLGAGNTGQNNHCSAVPIRLKAGDTVELQQVGKTMESCYFAGFSVDW